MLRNFCKWDYYITVARDGNFWLDGGEVNRLPDINELVQFISKSLRTGKTVILDEFQRLPNGAIEKLTTAHPSGTLILSGSNMGVVKSITGTSSPFLGLVKEVRIGLIHPRNLVKFAGSGSFLDYMVYLRDPWLIPLMSGKSILRDLYNIVAHATWTIPSLVGEVFIEENRKLTAIYEGITRSIGAGRGRPPEIASLLYARGIIKHNSSSAIAPYIRNLQRMGILKELKLYKRKGVIYRMLSPIFSVFYYISDKYPLEYNPPSFATAKKNLTRIHSLCYEDFIVGLLARILDKYVIYSTSPEIDGILVDHKGRPAVAVEVKHGMINKTEISNFLTKTDDIRTRVVVSKNAQDYDDVIAFTPDMVINCIRQWKIPGF